jgi:hypothetical protein
MSLWSVQLDMYVSDETEYFRLKNLNFICIEFFGGN